MAFYNHNFPMIDNKKIYVGRLPSVTDEELKQIFSLCGKIEDANVQSFTQRSKRQEERFTYGFLSFADEMSAGKALIFIDAVYKNQLIMVRKANETQYGTCVQNIPDGMPEQLIRSIFEQIGTVTVVPQGNYCFVNFSKEEDRQRAVNQAVFPIPFAPPLTIAKKEPKKSPAPQLQFTGEEFPVYITNIPTGTTDNGLQMLFTLCGPIQRVWVEDENGGIVFCTLNGQRKALQFTGTTPNEWTEAIEISLEPPMETTFSVVVTGIKDDIDAKLLQAFFADAGACTVEILKFERATVTFDTAECRDKALAYNGTPVGMTPGRHLTVEKNSPRR